MENIKGKNNISRISMCNFITLNVNDLTNLERQDILQIIFNTVKIVLLVDLMIK